MQTIVVYNVQKESEIKPVKEWYYGQYHPLGYGTRLERIEQREDGSYDLTFTRYTSCD